jgi:hypothetical protein
LELKDDDRVLGAGHAGLEEEDESKEGIGGWDEGKGAAQGEEKEGRGRHEEKAREADGARPGEEGRIFQIQTFESLGEGTGEDEEDGGEIGGAHGSKGVKKRRQGGGGPEKKGAKKRGTTHQGAQKAAQGGRREGLSEEGMVEDADSYTHLREHETKINLV